MEIEMRRLLAISCVAMALWIPAGAARANLIVNGGFETNSATASVFNPSNVLFNSTMSSVTAYGAREGIDIQTTGSGFGAAPQSGNWKVSPAADLGGLIEEFSMDLSGPVIAGLSYTLEFYIERLVNGPFDGGSVDIGLSSSATSFGTSVFTSASSTAGWTLESTTFVASANADFLTVRADTTGNRWVGLDTFSLTQVPEPSTALLLAFGLGGSGRAGDARWHALTSLSKLG